MAARLSLVVLAIAAALAGFALAGCGDDEATTAAPPSSPPPPANPTSAVSQAAVSTFEQPALKLSLEAGSPALDSLARSYSVRGLIEPSAGRFRVEPGHVSGDTRWLPDAVVGIGGEGYENTVEETSGGFGAGPGELCWFNPHAPAGGGFAETITMEEAVRVTGSVLESLRAEVKSADGAEGVYRVVLEPSASEPRDDFRDSDRRVWGDRVLLERLDGPIVVTISPAGEVERIKFEIRDYRPYYRPEGQDRTIPLTTIDAKLSPTSEELKLDPPQCQALE